MPSGRVFSATMKPSDQLLHRLSVLKAIQRHAPVARSALPELTGLSAGLITQLTAELLERGLIMESKVEGQGRGRPRVNLGINARGGTVIGAMLEGDGTLGVWFIDLSGNVLSAYKVPLSPAGTIDDLALAIIAALREALAQSGLGQADILHAAIAIPGIVDSRRGIIHFIKTMPLGPVAFAAPIAEALGIPVTIEGEMASMVRAEHWFGRMRDKASFSVLHFSHALGSGRYADGLAVTGASGISGEIGHAKIESGPHARPCFCGGMGCANSYASIFGMVEAAGLLRDLPFPAIRSLDEAFGELLNRAENGDHPALSLLKTAGEKLGVIVANHINVTDPGEILILLPDSRLHDVIRTAFDRVLEANVLPGMLGLARISFDLPLPDWRWKGTAALALEMEYLAPDRASR